MKKYLITPFVLLLLYFVFLPSAHIYAFDAVNGQVVNSNKTWNIKFNKELKFDELLKKSITVVDEDGKLVATELELGKNSRSILIKAPSKGYVLGGNYTLKIDSTITSTDNTKLQKPIEMQFKINNTMLVENNKDVKVVFNDNCNSLINGGWAKSLGDTEKSFVADANENEKYPVNIPYDQYLFYNTSKSSIAKLAKNVEIGAGPFNVEFDAKIADLQTPSKNTGWRGFVIDIIADNKRHRLSFNSKDTDNKIKIHLLREGSQAEPFETVDAYLPKDNNIHRWSIKFDGNKTLTVLLDGNKIASFNNSQLKSTINDDKVILYADMNDVLTGTNEVYIESFALVKTLAIKKCEVSSYENVQKIDVSVDMTIEDENILATKAYQIRAYLYKNDKIIAENKNILDKKNISFSLNNITQSGAMKVVVQLTADNKKIQEISKNITINISTVDMKPGQTISSQPGKIYIFNQLDKMASIDHDNAVDSGWNLEYYMDYEKHTNGYMIENGENAITIQMPVKLNGWFRVYIGYITGTENFKIGETGNPSSFEINGDISLKSNELYGNQWIYEKSTLISNFNNNTIRIMPTSYQRARIAYIKLVGLTDDQINLYKKPDENAKRVIYDFDGYSDFFSGKYPSVDSLKTQTIDKLVGKNVGEMNWCLGTTGMLNYNSKFAGNAFENLGEFDSQLRDGDKLAKKQILNILDSGKSPLEILAERGKEKAMKVDASLRMDVFYNPAIYGFLNGTMYEQYKQYAQPGDFLLSYYYPEFRAYVRNILKEASSFDNVGGVTLDFCRYPTVFGRETPPEEKVFIMNEFLKSVREEIPRSKTITVRVPYNDPIKYGFDIKTWIEKGFIDRLVPSSIGTEEFFNVNPYVDLVKGTNVKLYIGISANVSGHDITKEEEELVKQGLYIHNKEYLDLQQYLLRANEIYEAGADGIFLFNSTAKLYIDSKAPVQANYLGDKVQIEKWHEFEYISGFMINKINIVDPSLSK